MAAPKSSKTLVSKVAKSRRVGGLKKAKSPNPMALARANANASFKRRFESGPVGGKKVVKKAVSKALTDFPILQAKAAAKKARMSHGVNRAPDTLSPKGKLPVKELKRTAPAGKDPMSTGLIGDYLNNAGKAISATFGSRMEGITKPARRDVNVPGLVERSKRKKAGQ